MLLSLYSLKRSSLNSGPFSVPHLVRHPYKKDPKRDPNLEKHPNGFALAEVGGASDAGMERQLPAEAGSSGLLTADLN